MTRLWAEATNRSIESNLSTQKTDAKEEILKRVLGYIEQEPNYTRCN